MISLATIDKAEIQLQQFLAILRDRHTTSNAWETIILLEASDAVATLTELIAEIEQ